VSKTKFSCVVADPPWFFKDSLPGKGRGAEKHYPCLRTHEIQRFPLPPLADDCWLFLWRVGSQQQEALEVAKAWGFTVVSEIVWVKTSKDEGRRLRIGMGRTVRNCHEVCLVCRRGKPHRDSASVPSVIFAKRGEHSAKPDEFFEAVDGLVGDVPRVELFSRKQRDGWVCLGNEVKSAKAEK
jgi:N6-adenosine-specific RNA methylase IME4